MALLAATIIILVAIAVVAMLRATILDIAGLVRGDLACQSQMQQRRYDDVVGLCERIEATIEANQKGWVRAYVGKQEKQSANRPS